MPSLTGDLDALRAQIAAAKNAGIDTVMVQPMIMGLSNFAKLVAENRDLAFFAHPTLAGAARIAPPLLFGKLFRMLGADALVFPNHGGRFGYYAGDYAARSPATALGGLARPEAGRAGSGRRHDDRSRRPRCLISTVQRSCC